MCCIRHKCLVGGLASKSGVRVKGGGGGVVSGMGYLDLNEKRDRMGVTSLGVLGWRFEKNICGVV